MNYKSTIIVIDPPVITTNVNEKPVGIIVLENDLFEKVGIKLGLEIVETYRNLALKDSLISNVQKVTFEWAIFDDSLALLIFLYYPADSSSSELDSHFHSLAKVLEAVTFTDDF